VGNLNERRHKALCSSFDPLRYAQDGWFLCSRAERNPEGEIEA